MSIAQRAVIAVLLMISFYVFAFGIAGALLGLAYLQVISGHIFLKIVLAMVIFALIIIWAVLPRWDFFKAPGPELKATDYPELFRGIGELANKCGHPVPRHIYLLHDANAWVTQRGGIMGFFSKPVMAIGLPLFKILTTEQLFAVIAHEFGHFVGGDTRLGPWIYKTRQAIGRTINSINSWIKHAFIWYGNMFLRITQAISRQQEFSADALAAQYVGKTAIKSALEKIANEGMKYDSYFNAEVAPLLERGFMPDIDGGYAQALKNTKFVSNVETSFVSGEKSPYDSHPPLAERVAAIEALTDAKVTATNEKPALSLLQGDISVLEKKLYEFILKIQLKDLAWNESVEVAYKPLWTELVENNTRWLGKPDADTIFKMAQDLEETVKRINKGAKLSELGADQVLLILQILGAALALRLLENGYTAKIEIGSEWEFTKGDKKINPFSLMHEATNSETQKPDF
ncbi:MAG: M48 family metallopeptidase [Turneriella sp.]|nr:M48 family metallopeptidase [Turneriella sp.]